MKDPYLPLARLILYDNLFPGTAHEDEILSWQNAGSLAQITWSSVDNLAES